MSDLTLYPADIAAMSVGQLAALPPAQKAQISRNLDEALAWLKQARAKFDAALEAAYGEQARAARLEAGKDFGVVHLTDGALRVTVDVPKRVAWDQAQLAAIAGRIAAAGERVEDYLDVEYSVSESRFNHWPAALRAQFEPARTVKPGKPTFRLTLTSED
ncbi:hypothetical protein EDC61_1284 [Sulfuritortus calidifontis]|uniref:Uncharacterized protein n=1 Tax=Sulfuritortus calidifontis TaxID=1914471 RepID=A0A4R3JP63_9PROT|nr:hypothetical protein [Sulfuritortus calidifontis]TCS68290.1 hypothetical protein EDC61_1284 [Sulfuritortus calidifontis]